MSLCLVFQTTLSNGLSSDNNNHKKNALEQPQQEQVSYEIQHRHLLAARCEYFASLEGWQQLQLDVEPIVGVPDVTLTVQFVQALDQDKSDDACFSSLLTTFVRDPVHRQAFYPLWLFWGLSLPVLRDFSNALSRKSREEWVRQCLEAPDDLDVHPLVLELDLWQDARPYQVPICRDYCRSVSIAMALLQAYDHAQATHTSSSPPASPRRLWESARQQFQQSVTRNGPETITCEEFALETLQRFAGELSQWTPDSILYIFGKLPETIDTDQVTPPQGLELLVKYCLENNLFVPYILRTWNLNAAVVAHALFAADRLDEAVSYSNPQGLVETVVAGWTPQQLVTALEQDQGGMGRLLDVLNAQKAPWLAQIPVFCDARHVAQGLDRVSLVGALFLWTEFDETLPPELLATLPLDEMETGQRAVQHAVQYLEAGQDSPVFSKLRWEAFLEGPWLDRAVQALQVFPTHPVWNRLDLEQVEALDCVPTPILAAHAAAQNRQARVVVDKLLDRVSALEECLGQLERKVQEMQMESTTDTD